MNQPSVSLTSVCLPRVSGFRPGARALVCRFPRAVLPGYAAIRRGFGPEAVRSGCRPRRVRLCSALPALGRPACCAFPPPVPSGRYLGLREVTSRFVPEKNSALPRSPVASPLPPAGRPLAGFSAVFALLANAPVSPLTWCSGLPLEFVTLPGYYTLC